MVKEKLDQIRRSFLINIIYILLNLKANSKYLLFILLYFQLLLITLFFGLWDLFGFIWHLLYLIIFFSLIAYLIIEIFKNYKYYNKNFTLLWIDKNNFKSINPLTSFKDKPESNNYNKYLWYLHKASIMKNIKNIKFHIPNIFLGKSDPLLIRYLFLTLLIVALYWAYKKNKIDQNVYGVMNFSQYFKQEDLFEIKAWLEPPKYTNLKHKLIDIPKDKNNLEINEYVPINSLLNIFINSNKNNFSVEEHKKIVSLKKNSRNSYKLALIIDKNKIVSVKNDTTKVNFNFAVVKDAIPKIKILSSPNTVNEVALSFISKISDDYGIESIKVELKRPIMFKHFEEEMITYNLFNNINNQENTKYKENYFYKYFADIVWAGSSTFLEIIASDYAKQHAKISIPIKIPQKTFKNEVAIQIISIRNSLAKKEISAIKLKEELFKIFSNNNYLIEDTNIESSYVEINNILNRKKAFTFSITDSLFKKLYDLAEIIEDGKFYSAKKNLEQVEQSLFDSIKQKESDKISSNSKKFKESIESLLNLDNKERNEKNYNEMANKTVKDEIDRLTKQIEDLLKTGTQEGINEKIQKLQQLSESIKNPNSNQESEAKYQQKQDFINKLSELLNEQEKVMEETFNKAADRGKFKQSSEGSGGKSPKERQEELRNTLGNVIRDIAESENEIPQDLGRADRAMRQASRDLENGRPDEASNAQGRAVEMIQRSINKINSEEYMSDFPQITQRGEEVSKNNDKEYLADNESIEYQGSSAGGKLELLNNKKIKSASKIANELYKRYNQENRSISDKDHIKNLLDWY
jgi:hypothetical protein